MTKRVIITIVIVVIVIGVVGGIKVLQIQRMIAQGKNFVMPPATVTTASVTTADWDQSLTSVGSLTAVQGVMVTAESPGKVVRILFEPGSKVKAGDLLVKQDTSSEEAQLRAAEAAAQVAKLSLERTRKLFAQRSIARSDVDSAEAQYKQTTSQADNIRTAIDKKNIRAPFSGRLGIRLVNIGQYIHAGEEIVSLQSMNPIYADFYLPQQDAVRVQPGYQVRLTSDALDGEKLEGKITAINPQVDAKTRAIKIQATVKNQNEHLLPGMFVNVKVILPGDKSVTLIPVTSVLYAPYGDSVFVVEDKKPDAHTDASAAEPKTPQKVLRQQFVRLGEKRGDFIALISGLKGDETIVSTGVFKLRNAMPVVIDNTLEPEFKLNPTPKDS